MVSSTKDEERRTARRYALHLKGTGKVLYRRDIPQRPGTTPIDPSNFRVETVNVSTGGFLLAFDAELSSGDCLRMTFLHPETSQELVAEAQIQWMQKNKTGLLGRYCAGVSFRNTPNEVVQSLLYYAVMQSQPAK